MLTVLKTKPTQNVVTLEELKNHLRVDLSDDDQLITSMLKAVTFKVEAMIDRKLMKQQWEIYWDNFPMRRKDDWWDGVRDMAISELVTTQRYLQMPFGPMQAAGFVFETFDNDNTAIVFDPANYVLDTQGPFGRMALRLSSVWPATVLRTINGLRATAWFGVDTPEQVPDDIKLAIKMWVATMYEHRGDDVATTCPVLAISLLEPFKMHKVGGCG